MADGFDARTDKPVLRISRPDHGHVKSSDHTGLRPGRRLRRSGRSGNDPPRPADRARVVRGEGATTRSRPIACSRADRADLEPRRDFIETNAIEGGDYCCEGIDLRMRLPVVRGTSRTGYRTPTE